MLTSLRMTAKDIFAQGTSAEVSQLLIRMSLGQVSHIVAPFGFVGHDIRLMRVMHIPSLFDLIRRQDWEVETALTQQLIARNT